jgi:hypothetical protein
VLCQLADVAVVVVVGVMPGKVVLLLLLLLLLLMMMMMKGRRLWMTVPVLKQGASCMPCLAGTGNRRVRRAPQSSALAPLDLS